jgi:hypothetical protein
LGLLCDAALHCELIKGADRRAPYWMLRRSIRLFQELTVGVDLTEYEEVPDEAPDYAFLRELYTTLEDHGFELYDYDEALIYGQELRAKYSAQLEYLIDASLAPRGFWGHDIGYQHHQFADAGSGLD